MLSATSLLHADEQSSVSNTIADTTKDYLSDPARTGSLVGSIIAGSAVANPLAPLLGSVVGFVIGKSSAFSDKNGKSARRLAYNNRSLLLDNGAQVTSVTGLSSTSTLATIPANGVKIAAEAGTQPRPTNKLALNGNSSTGSEVEDIPTLAAAKPDVKNSLSDEVVIVESMSRSQLAHQSDTLVPIDLVRETYMEGTSTDTMNNQLREESPGALDLQRKLANACSNSQTIKPTSMICYYNAQ